MNEVAKKKGTEVSTDLMSDIFAVAGEGAVFDVDELIVPRIKIMKKQACPITNAIEQTRARRTKRTMPIKK